MDLRLLRRRSVEVRGARPRAQRRSGLHHQLRWRDVGLSDFEQTEDEGDANPDVLWTWTWDDVPKLPMREGEPIDGVIDHRYTTT
jgi:hypothetical protein